MPAPSRKGRKRSASPYPAQSTSSSAARDATTASVRGEEEEDKGNTHYLNISRPKAKGVEKRRMALCAKRPCKALESDSDSDFDDDTADPPDSPCSVADDYPVTQQTQETRDVTCSAPSWSSPPMSPVVSVIDTSEVEDDVDSRPSDPPFTTSNSVLQQSTAVHRLTPTGISGGVADPAPALPQPNSDLTQDKKQALTEHSVAQTLTDLQSSLFPPRPPSTSTALQASAPPSHGASATQAAHEPTHTSHPRSEAPTEELVPKGNLPLLLPQLDSLYPPKAATDQWPQEAASWEMAGEPFPEPNNYSGGLDIFTQHSLSQKEFNMLYVVSKNKHYAVCQQYLYDLGLAKNENQLLCNLFEGKFLASLLQAVNKERDLFKYSYNRLRDSRTSAYCLTDLTPKQRQAVNFVRNFNSSPTALLWISTAKGLPTKKLLELHLENAFRFRSIFQKEQLRYEELANNLMKRTNAYMSLPLQLLSGHLISGQNYYNFQMLQELSYLPEAFDWILRCAQQFSLQGLVAHLAYGKDLYQKLHNEFRSFPEKLKLFPFKSKPEIHSWKLTDLQLKVYTSMRDLKHSPSAQVWVAMCDTLQDLEEFESHFCTDRLFQTICTHEHEMELNNQEKYALNQESKKEGSLHEMYTLRRERFIKKRVQAFKNIILTKEEMLNNVGGSPRNLYYREEKARCSSTPDVNMESVVIHTPPPGCSSTVEALDKQRREARMVSKSSNFIKYARSNPTDIRKKLSYPTQDEGAFDSATASPLPPVSPLPPTSPRGEEEEDDDDCITFGETQEEAYAPPK